MKINMHLELLKYGVFILMNFPLKKLEDSVLRKWFIKADKRYLYKIERWDTQVENLTITHVKHIAKFLKSFSCISKEMQACEIFFQAQFNNQSRFTQQMPIIHRYLFTTNKNTTAKQSNILIE